MLDFFSEACYAWTKELAYANRIGTGLPQEEADILPHELAAANS